MTKAQKETLAAYKSVFESPNGQLVLADLRAAYGDRPSYCKGDPHQTAFNEGGRSLYLRIVAAIEEARQAERASNGRQRITRTDTIESDAGDDADITGGD